MGTSPSSAAILQDDFSTLIWVSLSPNINSPILQTDTEVQKMMSPKACSSVWKAGQKILL